MYLVLYKNQIISVILIININATNNIINATNNIINDINNIINDINKVKSKKLINKSDKLIDFLYIFSFIPNISEY